MRIMRPAFIYNPAYEIDIGDHVFLTTKFRGYFEECVREGLLKREEVEKAPTATDEELLCALEPGYLSDLLRAHHTHRTIRSELPIDEDIIAGCIATAGGSIRCAQRALESGISIHFGGGFHHGFADHAEGFCYINDVAVAAAVALRRGWCRKIAIVDTDVHQGNGTARIFSDDPRVFTFSIHQENLYPMKEASTLDIGMEDNCGDERYLAELARGLLSAVVAFNPELVIYVGGVDPYEHDQLGSLGLTFEGMRARDMMALEAAAERGIPFMTVMAGGYADDPNDTVRLHTQTARVVLELAAKHSDRYAGRKPLALEKP